MEFVYVKKLLDIRVEAEEWSLLCSDVTFRVPLMVRKVSNLRGHVLWAEAINMKFRILQLKAP
jgi:hypothetical protein